MSDRKLLQSIAGLSSEFRLAAMVSWLPSNSLSGWHMGLVNRLCGQVANWDDFLSLVDRHRIPALAYANLAEFREVVPADVLDALKKRSNVAKLYALRHAAEYSRLASLLDQAGIPCLPLKGQMLSQQLYGDPATRQTKDIDLLIRPQDLEKTDNLLRAEGYQLVEADSGLSPAQARFVLSGHQHYGYHHRQRGLILELHWRCDLWSNEDMQLLWDNTDSTRFGGLELQIMSEELQLVFLCDHGSRHKWFRLKWLGDIARIITENRVASWQKIIGLAEQLDLQRSLGQSAVLLKQLYDIPLPEPLSQLANTGISERLACEALIMMKKSDADINNLSGKGEAVRNIFYLKRLRPSLPIMTLLRCMLVSTADYELVRLPDRLFWLYIPLRPVLWFWRNYMSRWIRT